MCKRNLISFIVIVLAAMSLIGCGGEGKGAAPELYGTDSEAYFTASYYLSQPSIEKADFSFPLVSKRELKEITDFCFYNNGAAISTVKVISCKLVPSITRYNGSEGEEVRTEDYRYKIWVEFSIYEMTEEEPILIDEVRIIVDKHPFSFKVDVEIHYEYTDYNEVPDIMICSAFGNQDYDTVEGGIVVINTLLQSRQNAVINKIVLRSMEVEWDAIRIKKWDFYEGWGEYVPFEEGFEIEKTEYKIQIEIANSKITAFADETIDLYVTVNGLYDTVWRTNMDWFNSFLPSKMLSDANRTFF